MSTKTLTTLANKPPAVLGRNNKLFIPLLCACDVDVYDTEEKKYSRNTCSEAIGFFPLFFCGGQGRVFLSESFINYSIIVELCSEVL